MDTNQLEWTLALALRQGPAGFDPLIASCREYEAQKGRRGSGQWLYDTSNKSFNILTTSMAALVCTC